MKKILLICSSGMSTSLLVTSMEKAARQIEMEVLIKAVPISDVDYEMKMGNWDIALLGPQVRYAKRVLEKRLGNTLPMEIINIRDYGLMNGDKILEMAIQNM